MNPWASSLSWVSGLLQLRVMLVLDVSVTRRSRTGPGGPGQAPWKFQECVSFPRGSLAARDLGFLPLRGFLRTYLELVLYPSCACKSSHLLYSPANLPAPNYPVILESWYFSVDNLLCSIVSGDWSSVSVRIVTLGWEQLSKDFSFFIC